MRPSREAHLSLSHSHANMLSLHKSFSHTLYHVYSSILRHARVPNFLLTILFPNLPSPHSPANLRDMGKTSMRKTHIRDGPYILHSFSRHYLRLIPNAFIPIHSRKFSYFNMHSHYIHTHLHAQSSIRTSSTTNRPRFRGRRELFYSDAVTASHNPQGIKSADSLSIDQRTLLRLSTNQSEVRPTKYAPMLAYINLSFF